MNHWFIPFQGTTQGCHVEVPAPSYRKSFKHHSGRAVDYEITRPYKECWNFRLYLPGSPSCLNIDTEKAMAPHSSTLAWKIPWTEEPGRLQSIGSLELDTTERLHFHFSLSCIGEGNGNPLQCSCLENPRDRGAWCAAVYGVAQSRTRLK